MRRTVLPLLMVFALLLVAVGGTATAGDASTNTDFAPDEADGDDAGICLVGTDSACNDAPVEETDSDEPSADDGHARIPEDRNGDGEIDDRFRGDGEGIDAGICPVGADSLCNGAADDERLADDGPTEDAHPAGPEGDSGPGDRNFSDVLDRFASLLGPFGTFLPFPGGF